MIYGNEPQNVTGIIVKGTIKKNNLEMADL